MGLAVHLAFERALRLLAKIPCLTDRLPPRGGGGGGHKSPGAKTQKTLDSVMTGARTYVLVNPAEFPLEDPKTPGSSSFHL